MKVIRKKEKKNFFLYEHDGRRKNPILGNLSFNFPWHVLTQPLKKFFFLLQTGYQDVNNGRKGKGIAFRTLAKLPIVKCYFDSNACITIFLFFIFKKKIQLDRSCWMISMKTNFNSSRRFHLEGKSFGKLQNFPPYTLRGLFCSLQ